MPPVGDRGCQDHIIEEFIPSLSRIPRSDMLAHYDSAAAAAMPAQYPVLQQTWRL